MKAIRIEPGKEPRVVDVLARTIEKALDDMVHEEVLPIEGTMSLSALRTDGLESNDLMAERTGDDGMRICRRNRSMICWTGWRVSTSRRTTT